MCTGVYESQERLTGSCEPPGVGTKPGFSGRSTGFTYSESSPSSKFKDLFNFFPAMDGGEGPKTQSNVKEAPLCYSRYSLQEFGRGGVVYAACEDLECTEELWDNIRVPRLCPLSAVLCSLTDIKVTRPPGLLLLRVMPCDRFDGRYSGDMD